MSVTETMPGPSLPVLGKEVQFALPDPCLRGIAVPPACSKPSPLRRWLRIMQQNGSIYPKIR
jgi:hypothetical protein